MGKVFHLKNIFAVSADAARGAPRSVWSVHVYCREHSRQVGESGDAD